MFENFLFLSPIRKTVIRKQANSFSMLSIQVKEGDNIERALKQFKKKFDQTKTMKQLRTRREFVKPSVINRNTRKKAVYKNGLNLKSE